MPGLIYKFFASFHKKLDFFEKISGLSFFRFDNLSHSLLQPMTS